MIFNPPLLWTSDTVREFQKLLGEFAKNEPKTPQETLEIRWWWEPFHRPGLKALRWAATHTINAAELEKILEDLSCPGASAKLISRHGLQNFADESGALLPLDPARFIKATWEAACENAQPRTADIAAQGNFLPTTSALKNILSPWTWTPVLTPQEFPEVHELSRWLTSSSSFLKRFHDLDPWGQLACIESFIGVTKSQTTLHFQRVYSL